VKLTFVQCECHTGRSVTRLDVPQGKKQVWPPMFEPEIFRKQISLLKKVLVTLLGFLVPLAVIWRPHNVSAPRGLCPTCPLSLRPCMSVNKVPLQKSINRNWDADFRFSNIFWFLVPICRGQKPIFLPLRTTMKVVNRISWKIKCPWKNFKWSGNPKPKPSREHTESQTRAVIQPLYSFFLRLRCLKCIYALWHCLCCNKFLGRLE